MARITNRIYACSSNDTFGCKTYLRSHDSLVWAHDVLLLKEAARLLEFGRTDHIISQPFGFKNYTDENLWHDRGDFLNQTRHVKYDSGEHLLYLPRNVSSFVFSETSDNIVRIIHGALHGVW